MNSTNKIVQNALKAKACNTSQLELSLRYAGRLQSELRDVARSGNGRVSSSNTVEFPNEDAAEDAMEYLVRYAHVPKDEVWINSRVRNSAVATNALPEEEVRKLLLGLAEAKKKYDKFDKEYNRLSDLTAEALGGRTSAWRDINKMERLLDKGNNAGIVGKLMKELHLTIGDITI